jgi:hypothetical protein
LGLEPRKNDLKEADRFGLLFVTEGHNSVSRRSPIERVGPKLTFGILTFGPLLCNIDSSLLFFGTGLGEAACVFVFSPTKVMKLNLGHPKYKCALEII